MTREATTSADGTRIGLQRLGGGPPVVLVNGTACDATTLQPLAWALAEHFTVVTYDRRGRGRSGDTPPYAVAREVEDLAAVVAAAGSRVSVYGDGSGGALSIHAAASGVRLAALAVYEPPYSGTGAGQRDSRAYATTLRSLLARGRRSDAVALYLTRAGITAQDVADLRTQGWWEDLTTVADTLDYDSQVMGELSRCGVIPAELVARVETRTLVVSGGASPSAVIEVDEQLAAALAAGEHRLLAGQDHTPSPAVLTPVLVEFLTR